MRVASKYTKGDGRDIIHIIDSKRMDLKHPQSIKVFTGCYPTKMSSPINPEPKDMKMKPDERVNPNPSKDISVEFSVQRPDYLPQVSALADMMGTWIKGITS